MAVESGTNLTINSGLPFRRVTVDFDKFLNHESDSATIGVKIDWNVASTDPAKDPTTGAFITPPPSEYRLLPSISRYTTFSLRPTVDSGGQGRHIKTVDGKQVRYTLWAQVDYGDGPIEVITSRPFDVDYIDADGADDGVVRLGELIDVDAEFAGGLSPAAQTQLDNAVAAATSGFTGGSGVTGLTGSTGATGPQGLQGIRGPAGVDGATGPIGPEGPEGPEGPQGPAGADGTGTGTGTGPAGPIGPEGPVGSTGPEGPEGPEGPAGVDGAAGAIGSTGPTGLTGATGPQGPQGATGPAGDSGTTTPTDPNADVDPTLLARLWKGWSKAGLTNSVKAYVDSVSLPVHSTLSSPTVAALNTAMVAASNASTGGVPQVVEASGTMTINDEISMQDFCVLRCPDGQSLVVETAIPMDTMIEFAGGFFQSRNCTLTGVFNSYEATVNDPNTELTLGIWQFGSNSSDGPGGQIVDITAINGSTVTLAEPLVQDFTNTVMKTMNGGLSEFVNRAGLEGDITVRPLHDVTDLISTRAAYDCWISNGVKTDGTTDDGINGTGVGQQVAAVKLRQSYHCLVQDTHVDNARNHGDGGSGYGINIMNITSACLVNDVTVNRMRHSVLFHVACAGNVLSNSFTGNPIHPNYPNGGPTEVSFHGYCAANLVINNDTGRIMLVDAGQPGPNNCLAFNSSRTGPLTLDGTSTNDLTDTICISNIHFGSVAALSDLYVPPLFDQPNTAANQRGDINGWSPLRWFWYGSYDPTTVGDTVPVSQPVGAYEKGSLTPDPFAAANGYPAGIFLRNPSQVDTSSVIVDNRYSISEMNPQNPNFAGDGGTTNTGGGGSTTTTVSIKGEGLLVAASNASQQAKDAAYLVCTGADDQVEIQSAIDAASAVGGLVKLTHGDFLLDDRIIMRPQVRFAGEHQFATILKPASDWALGGGVGVGGYVIEGTADIAAAAIEHIGIHGLKGSRDVGGIRLEPSTVPSAFSPDSKLRVNNIHVLGTKRHPIYMDGANGQGRGSQYSHLEIFSCDQAVIAGSNDCQWDHLHVGGSAGHGIEVLGGNQHFTDAKFWFSDGDGFHIASQRNMFTACESQDNEEHGFNITQGKNSFVNCSADSNSYRTETSPNKTFDGYHIGGGLGFVMITGIAFDKKENRQTGQTPTSHQRHAVGVGTAGNGAFPSNSVIDVVCWDHFGTPSGGGAVPATSRVDIRGT